MSALQLDAGATEFERCTRFDRSKKAVGCFDASGDGFQDLRCVSVKSRGGMCDILFPLLFCAPGAAFTEVVGFGENR